LQEKANAQGSERNDGGRAMPDGPLEQGGFFGTSSTADFTKQAKPIIDA
jgi:hypothetical protein